MSCLSQPIPAPGTPLPGRDHTGIMGHSMGGHGAITIALKNPDMYKSLSAFAPICNPMNVPWGLSSCLPLGNYPGGTSGTPPGVPPLPC